MKSDRFALKDFSAWELKIGPFSVLPSWILNISDGGLCLRLGESSIPSKGKALKLVVTYEGEIMLSGDAVAVWHKPESQGSRYHRVGFEFQNKEVAGDFEKLLSSGLGEALNVVRKAS